MFQGKTQKPSSNQNQSSEPFIRATNVVANKPAQVSKEKLVKYFNVSRDEKGNKSYKLSYSSSQLVLKSKGSNKNNASGERTDLTPGYYGDPNVPTKVYTYWTADGKIKWQSVKSTKNISLATADDKAYFMNDQGFWIEGEPNFGEYLGNQKPAGGQAGYMELVNIRGDYYHKNTSNIGASAMNEINSWFGGDDDYNVEKKEYNHAEESFNGGLRFATGFYVSGLILGKLGAVASKLLKGAGNSIWKLLPLERGFVYEEVLKANLRHIKNYPVIDDFIAATGKATSVKTLDLAAKTYLKSGKPVFNQLRNYIDKLAKFKGANWGKFNTVNKIKSKVLELGVPPGATPVQLVQINNAIAYANSNNIKLIVRIVK